MTAKLIEVYIMDNCLTFNQLLTSLPLVVVISFCIGGILGGAAVAMFKRI